MITQLGNGPGQQCLAAGPHTHFLRHLPSYAVSGGSIHHAQRLNHTFVW